MIIEKYDLPSPRYAIGEKKMVSWRLPERLLAEINMLAEECGYSTTQVVTTILDQAVQQNNSAKKTKRKR